MLKVNTILVPTDFSKNSDLALKKAIPYVSASGAILHLTYVTPEVPDIFKLSKYMEKGRQKIQDELEQSCAAYFEKQINRVDGARDRHARTDCYRVCLDTNASQRVNRGALDLPDLVRAAVIGAAQFEHHMGIAPGD